MSHPTAPPRKNSKRAIDFRARKRLVVRFRADTPEIRTAFTGNLSEHGILLQTKYVHPPGTTLNVEIKGPEKSYSLVGRIIWVKRVSARLAQVTNSSMGIYFKDPSPDWTEFCKAWNQS